MFQLDFGALVAHHSAGC